LSRLRSRSAASAGGAAPRGGNAPRGNAPRGVYVQTPQSDIYVALLGVALGAMVLGCILLILVLNRYGFSMRVSSTSAPTLGAVASGSEPGPIFAKNRTVHL
jgi:hypothetical protein